MHQNGSTQLLVDMSIWVDLAARADTSRQVEFATGANTSRRVDLDARADKSRWVDLAAGADKSRGSNWLPEPTCLDKLTLQNRSTQLPVDTSRRVDLATIADMSGCHQSQYI